MNEALAKKLIFPEVEDAGGKKSNPVAKQLPEPAGYKILITLPAPEKETSGGIIKAAETLRVEEVGSICGFVLKMGPDAYKDPKRFPGDPYCKVGDWIVMPAYSGTRLLIHGEEMRLISDDTVEAVVQDPRGIIKA